jgi:hypothetical protein
VISSSLRVGRRSGLGLRVLVLVVAVWPPHVALPAELYADGRVGQQFEYDSNIDLGDDSDDDLSEDGDDAYGSRSTVGVTLGARTPAVDLALGGEFRLIRFPNESRLDSEDASLTGSGRWDWRRASLGLEAGVTRDTTREVEDVQTIESITANEERLTFSVSSSLDYQLSRLQTAGLTLSYQERIFPGLSTSEARDLDLEEFSFYRLGGNWRRSLTPVLGLTGTLGSSYFDSDQEETITGQAQLGLDYGLTPALRVNGSIGPSIASTEEKGPLGESDTTLGFVWDAGLNYRPSADAALQARLFQDFAPQSTGGELVLRTGLQLTFDYEVTRYTSFSLPIAADREDPVGGDSDVGYFARVEPRLSFKITPQASIGTSYRFRYLDEEEESATSHAIVLDFGYDFPSFLTSR